MMGGIAVGIDGCGRMDRNSSKALLLLIWGGPSPQRAGQSVVIRLLHSRREEGSWKRLSKVVQ